MTTNPFFGKPVEERWTPKPQSSVYDEEPKTPEVMTEDERVRKALKQWHETGRRPVCGIF